ncbi:MAG: hypothetical protein WC969_03505 [Elusimicrobiota bacterium]|jgi:hypothetical protein
MKSLLATTSLVLFGVACACALETPESIRSAGTSGFAVAEVSPQPALKTSRHVRVSGTLSLNGSGYVPQSNYANVSVSGSVDARGEGGYATGYTTVTQTLSFFVNGNFVTQWVNVNAYVSVYKDGRFVGSTYLNGSVLLTGWKNGDWLHLNGSGAVAGDLFVQE